MKRNRPGSGFTLVELLVSLAIVSGLAVTTFGVVTGMRARTDEVACANNLRQIGIGLQAYAQDHGHFPETTHTESLERSWIFALEDYLGDFDEARICPADPKAAERLEAEGTSYILNSFIFVPKTDPFGRPTGRLMNRPNRIPHPSRTMMAFVASDEVGVAAGNDHTHSERWDSWSAVIRDIAPDRHGDERSNYLYADGRVASIAAAEVRRRIENGDNIAEPPGMSP